MKHVLLTLLLITSLFSYGQFQFVFPDNIEFEPNNSNLNILGVKKVEQYSISKSSSDSIFGDKTLDYIFEYDSLSRLKSWKYDFKNESFEVHKQEGFSEAKVYHYTHGNANIIKFFNGSTKVNYNYSECKFTWENHRLKTVFYEHAKYDQRNQGFNHGAFTFIDLSRFHPTIEKVYEEERIIEKTTFYEKRLKTFSKYKYKAFTVPKSGEILLLLDAIVVKHFDEKGLEEYEVIKQINYTF
ncbi:hypothetical protein ERX46_10750 [Brumimicrobium glaciale]|uniref:Uncharacterized protein n=1 Tax=Brumimicrobium glaciale TaxID=200475 RepID=A0A4Q4KJG0_9FLAO|nr:hypothetical protein [Brumimicrobium glaciale]RYM33411.1 hypothetical protein ERX46_10750 [Brumimicrobium glaciale]